MAILKVWDNDNSDWLVPTNNATDNILLRVYPVGSIYMSVNNIDPGTLFGGTWAAWGSGRVPVGVDTGQTEFDAVEKTGGAKTHTLTEAQIPSHRHTSSSSSNFVTDSGAGANVNSASGGAYAFRLHSNVTAYTGGGQSHNNLQPYITCYMFKRVS